MTTSATGIATGTTRARSSAYEEVGKLLAEVEWWVPAGQIGIYVSEPMVELYGAKPGALFTPLSNALGTTSGSAPPAFFVAGVWRDYARQFGAITMDARDFERLKGIFPAIIDEAKIALDQEIPPVADFAAQQTKYVKYVRIRSERLSKFWGRDMHLAAWVLLPWGFDEHPDAHADDGAPGFVVGAG